MGGCPTRGCCGPTASSNSWLERPPQPCSRIPAARPDPAAADASCNGTHQLLNALALPPSLQLHQPLLLPVLSRLDRRSPSGCSLRVQPPCPCPPPPQLDQPLLLSVLSSLDRRSLVAAAATCRHLRELTRDVAPALKLSLFPHQVGLHVAMCVLLSCKAGVWRCLCSARLRPRSLFRSRWAGVQLCSLPPVFCCSIAHWLRLGACRRT